MNRKRKFNELYKGVFKNDKKSCLIDLKPLDQKRHIEKELNQKKEIYDQKNLNNFPKEDANTKFPYKNKNRLGINLRVAKNLGFGSFFRKVREEIVDIFLSKQEFISFEGLINSNSINDLFNFRDSTTKNFVEKEIINLDNTSKKENVIRNPQSYYNIANKTTEIIKREEEIGMNIINDDEEILYEDECETIYKKNKLSHHNNISSRKIQFYYDLNNNNNNNNSNYNNNHNFTDPHIAKMLEVGSNEHANNFFSLTNLNNLSELKKFNKMNNSSSNNILAEIGNVSDMSLGSNNFAFDKNNESNNIGNLSNFSRGSSNNFIANNFNQFIPINNKNSQFMTNKNLIEMDENYTDRNYGLFKMRQHLNNKMSNHHKHLLVSDENSVVGDNEELLAMKAIKQATIRGPLSNITNKFED